jgi:transposase-like protein
MYVKLNGEMVYLWRAVDHEGEMLESYITKTRDKEALATLRPTCALRQDRRTSRTSRVCADLPNLLTSANVWPSVTAQST